jgi:hypothetical protein
MRKEMSAKPDNCPECGSGLLQLLECEPTRSGRWFIRLRCAECWLELTGTWGESSLERFEESLARGVGQLTVALERMERANMAEAAERFRAALAADAILPMDF